METSDVRPPPARTINALPGHTTRADEPESLFSDDGSLAPPKKLAALMTYFAPSTFDIALDENAHIDVVRLRGADTINTGLAWYKYKGVKIVRLPDQFYDKLGIDPKKALAIPSSKKTPRGAHLAVMAGLDPFFIFCDVHPGSTLCGPKSRFWDGDTICAMLHAGANTERALAGLPLIPEDVSLFALHGFDPAEAGRRATAGHGEGPEWMQPCFRGGETTRAEWQRLREGHEAGTLDEVDEKKLAQWLEHCSRGGKATAAEWKRLREGHEAGTLDEADEMKLALWLDHCVRGGKATRAEWQRLREGHEAGTLDEADEMKLALWLDHCVRGGKATRAEWQRLREGHEAGTLDEEDEKKLAQWLEHCVRGGKAGGKATAAEWKRLREGHEAGTLDEEDEEKLALWLDHSSGGGKATAAEWKRLREGHEAGTLDEEDEEKLTMWLDHWSRGGKATQAEWKRLREGLEAGSLKDDDKKKLALLLDNCSRGGKAGGKAGGVGKEWKRLQDAEKAKNLTPEDKEKLAMWKEQREAAGRRGSLTTVAEDIEAVLRTAARTTKTWLTPQMIMDDLRTQKGREASLDMIRVTVFNEHLRFGWNRRFARCRGGKKLTEVRAAAPGDSAEAVGTKKLKDMTKAELRFELMANEVSYYKRDLVATLRDSVRELRARKQQESEAADDASAAAARSAAAALGDGGSRLGKTKKEKVDPEFAAAVPLEQETQASLFFTDCPLCFKSFPSSFIQSHVDTCPGAAEETAAREQRQESITHYLKKKQL